MTPLTIALFSSTELYEGPVAKLLGGADVGFVVGFFAAAALYVAIERLRAARPVPVVYGAVSSDLVS
jgi:NCS1 family nucleobase:cation symporter-1